MDSVARHYGRGGLGTRILNALEEAGKDIGRLEEADLDKIEEFHSRGRKATDELFEAAGFTPGLSVLDVGSGIGGPARFLARKGMRVTGIDLTPEFCEVARDLTRRSGLDGRIRFVEGDATSMPFDDKEFDAAWMQHANMNIRDKARLFEEVFRVLKLGGRFALHEVARGQGGEPHLPAPWASSPEWSHVVSPERLREQLGEAGFEVRYWKDDSEASVQFFEEVFRRIEAEGPPRISLNLLFGSDAPQLFRNFARSLAEDRCRVIMAVAQRPNA